MAEGRGFSNNPNKSGPSRDNPGATGDAPLRAGIEEISGIKKEELAASLEDSRKNVRAAIDWIQSNYGILIAAGLGVATVGFVMLWLNRKDGLRNFYEEESANPTLH